MNSTIDLRNPQEISRLRDFLLMAWNTVIGRAGEIRRQAKDQGNRIAIEWMEEIVARGREGVDVVHSVLPVRSHVSEEAVPLLRANLLPRIERVQSLLNGFQARSGGACAKEVEKIRHALIDLAEFEQGIARTRPAPQTTPPPQAFEMPAAGGSWEMPAGSRPHEMPGGRVKEMPPGSRPGPYQMPPAAAPFEMGARPTVYEMPPAQSYSTGDTPSHPDAHHLQQASCRALVVDDNQANRELLARTLESAGLTVATESDGAAAVEYLRREPVDLLLLDLSMPKMDGCAVLETLRSTSQLAGVSVLVMAEPEEQESVIRALALGAEDFIAKPIAGVILRSRVGSILRRRQAEAGRAAMAERLREVSRAESVGALAGGIAHDVTELLQAIVANTSLILGALPVSSPHAELLAKIATASERASELTRQLAIFAAQGPTAIRPVNLSETVQEIGGMLRAATPKHIRLKMPFTQGLPSVPADARQIQQLVFNLVANAGEAIGARQGTVTVETGLRYLSDELPADPPFPEIPKGYYTFVSVHDTGPGIDEAIRPRIFDPFFSTHAAGRGIGLSAAMGIARAHRGFIRVDTAPGKGSRFELLLPAQSPAD